MVPAGDGTGLPGFDCFTVTGFDTRRQHLRGKERMIFIIGGDGSGQREYAEQHFPDASIIDACHMLVKRQMEAGEDPLEFAEKLIREENNSSTRGSSERVIWSCEMGCGLVPLTAEERAWREASGRVNCRLAEAADTVIRTVCGIGTVIKAPAKEVSADRRPLIRSEIVPDACNEETRAKTIMVVGTMSNAGKSLVAAGLCRIFTEDGYRVAPFKAQNMALNSFITKRGEEMGRSQVVQAEACCREPDARMNPILLKPTTDKGSQIIVMGHPVADMDAKEYYRHKNEYLPYVKDAFDSLAKTNDIIVLEGAGSPAEINLKENDIVNMPMAAMADAPVILVGNIDPGGVFAQLYGTVKLLTEEEQDRICGLIINKFRGDLSILEPGIAMLEDLLGKPVLGVLPYMDVHLEPEDSLALEAFEREKKADAPDFREKTGEKLDIAVIRLPKISNFTDFEAISLEKDVTLRYVTDARALGSPDAILLPGTKSTIRDLMWLRESGLYAEIKKAHERGAFLVGICGGYQMLGKRIMDPDGAEMQGEISGFGYLDMETLFSQEKVMRQTESVSRFGIPALDGWKITGYEVHMGRETSKEEESGADRPLYEDASCTCSVGTAAGGGSAGQCGSDTAAERTADEKEAADSGIIGTYIHGLFDEDDFRGAFLEYLYERRGGKRSLPDAGSRISYQEFREKQLRDLAEVMRKHLDLPAIYRIMGLPGEHPSKERS